MPYFSAACAIASKFSIDVSRLTDPDELKIKPPPTPPLTITSRHASSTSSGVPLDITPIGDKFPSRPSCRPLFLWQPLWTSLAQIECALRLFLRTGLLDVRRDCNCGSRQRRPQACRRRDVLSKVRRTLSSVLERFDCHYYPRPLNKCRSSRAYFLTKRIRINFRCLILKSVNDIEG